MYTILIKQFLKTKALWFVSSMVLLLGVFSIYTAKKQQQQDQKAITTAITQQRKDIARQAQLHDDDLGLLLYYLRFSYIHKQDPLAAIAIGQSDIHAKIANVKILNLEGQKYNTDLVNPMRLHAGGIDLSFVILFLFPLVIIALTFDLLSKEIQTGTWNLIIIQSTSAFLFLLKKVVLRLFFVSLLLAVLFIIAKIVLHLPYTSSFMYMILCSYLYILFWFAICFLVILYKKSATVNTMILLTTWLLFLVLLPAMANSYITHSYPIKDAFSLSIKQRDAYHKRWDTDKTQTLKAFLKHYPQFSAYALKQDGFSWLWYYAMQQMGDDASKKQTQGLYTTLKNRQLLSQKIACFLPPLQLQLSMNAIAKTGMDHQLQFLDALTDYHEQLRLYFYPKIFDKQDVASISWEQFKPAIFTSKQHFSFTKSITPILIGIIILLGGIVFLRSNISKKID